MYERSLIYHKYTTSAYDEEPKEGHFSSCTQETDGVKRTDEWEHCRETFDNHFPRGQYFLFYTDEKGTKHKRGENVARFIAEVEKRLKVNPKSEILGFKNVSNIICVGMSKWWKENRARRQLFTILLRAGLKYHKNFESALYSYEYAEQTRDAIERFFQGYTHCAKKMTGTKGWVTHFDRDEADYELNDYDEEDEDHDQEWQTYLEKMLVKPTND